MSKSISSWSDLVVQEVVVALTPLADPLKAPAMSAYMKEVAPFLGIPSPLRASALRPVWKAVGKAPSARYPSLLSVIHRWAASDNRWLVRSAISHQPSARVRRAH